MVGKSNPLPSGPAGSDCGGALGVVHAVSTGDILRRLVPGAVALLFSATSVLAAPAGEIVVLCDTGVAPYRDLQEGFAQSSPLPVRVLPPEEAGGAGFEARLRHEGVRGVLAVGIQSRVAVEGLRELPVLLAMVPRVESWVAGQPNRLGIEMALSPRQHLETMRRVFPRARRVGVVFDPGQTGDYVREAGAEAGPGLTLVTREIARPAELSRGLDELRGHVDVIWLLPDPTVLQGANLNILLLASFESRIPLYGFARKYVELGAIAAAHLDPAVMGAQAARMLAAALDGPPAPAAARWRYATGAQLVVNQKVARKMGLDLDPALLEEADDVLR
jgi:putative ABC transport system substrate-binding protein